MKKTKAKASPAKKPSASKSKKKPQDKEPTVVGNIPLIDNNSPVSQDADFLRRPRSRNPVLGGNGK